MATYTRTNLLSQTKRHQNSRNQAQREDLCKLTRKINNKIKDLYKNFVMTIAEKEFDAERMFEIEKQINDIIGVIGLYLD